MKHKNPKRVILLANGDFPDPDYARTMILPTDMIIAANGGTRLAWELNMLPHLVIGDSDSLPDHLKEWITQNNVPRQEYPVAKDATDLELSLRYAIDHGAESVLMLGVTGRRIDHTLANLSLLALANEANIRAEVVAGREHIYLLHNRLELKGEPGQTVSLLPWGGAAEEVVTEGLMWELRGETLPFGPARGISNILREENVVITLSGGMLLVVHQRGDLH